MTSANDIVCFSEQENCYICLHFDNYEDKFHARERSLKSFNPLPHRDVF